MASIEQTGRLHLRGGRPQGARRQGHARRRPERDRARHRRAHVRRHRHRPPPTTSAWTSAPAISPPRATSIPAACPTRTRRRTPRCSPATSRLHAQARKMDSPTATARFTTKAASSMWQGANRIQARRGRSRPREAHPGRRRQRGHQPLGGAEGRPQKKKTAAAGADRSPRAAPGLHRGRTAWPSTPAAPRLSRPDLQVKSQRTPRLPGGHRRRLAAGEGVRRWRRRDRADLGKDRHLQRHRRAQRILHRRAEIILLGRHGRKWWTIQRQHHRRRPGGLTYFVNDDRLLVNGSDEPACQQPHLEARKKVNPHEQTRDATDLQNLSRPPCGGRRLGIRAAGRSGRAARPERRRQDHVVLHDRRADQPRFRPRSGGRRRTSPTCRCTSARAAASATCRRKPRSSASSRWKRT